MFTLLQDLRYGARMLINKPVFSLIAIVTLALGIGANTAIFSLVNTVLLKPLAFREPERLMMVWEDGSAIGNPTSEVTPATFLDWKTQNSVFDDMAALNWKNLILTGGVDPERVLAHGVSSGFFPLLGVQPFLGRNFSPDDDKADAPKVAILSNGLWKRRYGGSNDVIGSEIILSDEKHTVVGVLPAGFQFLQGDIGIWTPIALNKFQVADRKTHSLTVIARAKPRVSLEQAQADIKAISSNISREHPDDAGNLTSIVFSLREQIAGKVRQPLIVLLVAVGFVVLIACANIAGLQLSRAAGRRKEIAIRAALGATHRRIVRQLLTESVLLSMSGGGLGLIVALWSFTFLKQLIPADMIYSSTLKIDLPVLGYVIAISLFAGIVFGLAPALYALRVDVNSALKQGGRSTGLGARSSFRGAFVVAEVALAVVLLVGAGLMIQTVYNLRGQYSMFQPDRLLTLRTTLADSKFRELRHYVANEHTRRLAFNAQVLEGVATLPDVVSVGYTTSVPLGWKGGSSGLIVEGRQPQPGSSPSAIHRQVSSGYFETVGIGLRAGRFFDSRDDQQSLPVGIINETMARAYWPDEEPIGKRFKLNGPDAPWVTIVGIVADVRQIGMDAPVRTEMYFPYQQISSYPWFGPRDLVIRTKGDPIRLVPAIREIVKQADPNQPVSNVATMDELLTNETGSRRLGMILLSAYAGLALLLASLGIYGVLSYLVTQQTSELGVRMVLGATRGDVFALVIKKGMTWTLMGLTIGSGAAFGLTRLMSSLLFGVRSADSLTYISIGLLMVSVSLAACYVPARRAARVDPMVAINSE